MNKLVVFIVVLLWGHLAYPQSVAADIESLKVAFVYNFSKYIDWPDSAFATENDIVLCIAGKAPLVDKFHDLDGQLTHQKAIRVVAMRATGDILQTCHILFISAAYPTDTRQLLASLGHLPILTVGDHSGFASQGGIIELMEIHNRISFRINHTQAMTANLDISSKLLRLAR